MNDVRSLPGDVEKYSQTPLFYSDTDALMSAPDAAADQKTACVPDKLLNIHDLKTGTWGRLNVNRGQVKYYLQNSEEPLAVADAGDQWVILPEEKHYIQVSRDVEFFIEFFRKLH